MRSGSSDPDPENPPPPPRGESSSGDASPPPPRPDSEGSSGDGAEGGERRAEGGIPGHQLERVIRRAVELQYQVGQQRDDHLPDGEVVRIGREVGVDPRHVRRALLEYRGGALAGNIPGESDRLSPLLGPSFLRASRTVQGDAEEIQWTVEGHFKTRESLQAVRRLPGVSLWESSGGVLSAAQRALNVHGLGYQLARTRAVELAVAEVEESKCLVTLTADVRNVRADSAWGWVFLGILAIFVPNLVVGPLVDLPGGVLWALGAVLGGAVALLGTRRNVRRETGRIRLVMEGLLDRLETGQPLHDEPPSWRDRLLP